MFYESLKYFFYKKKMTINIRMSFVQEYKKYILYIFFIIRCPSNIIIKNIFVREFVIISCMYLVVSKLIFKLICCSVGACTSIVGLVALGGEQGD